MGRGRAGAAWGRALAALPRGPAGAPQARAVALMACVLALNTADTGVIGALVQPLRRTLHIGNVEVGLLTAVPAAVGAVATVPAGMLTDRVPRVPLLAGSIVLWSAAMAAGGLAPSYGWLLGTRVALGAVTATAGPAVASLVGDLFPARERAGAYGRILAGELIGVGFGLVMGGNVAAAWGWRAAFWIVAVLGVVLAAALWRLLPEPERGGQSGARGPRGAEVARRAVDEAGVEPRARTVLRTDPARLSLPQATLHVLRIPTNVVIILASTIGYFFFAGLRTFALVFVQHRYGIGHLELTATIPLIGAGALAGVLTGGRLADRLVRRGAVAARLTVPAAAYALSALLFLPGLLTTRALLALPLFTLAAAALAAANPPLDAVRLDVVHFGLWGRAESIRTIARMSGEAIAPVLFGWLSGVLASGGSADARGAAGLNRTFLLALLPLLLNGLLLLRARRAYPVDVASATASERVRDEPDATPREGSG